MNHTVSIIIPTHNRCRSLKRLLDKLGCQDYPTNLMEVIVVADGCIDESISLLKEYRPNYKLLYFEQAGLGAAAARNNGAGNSTGEILLFLDDDIEPSMELVSAHIEAHKNNNSVVIGYLPMDLPIKATIHQINLASWWEKKYRDMGSPGYRFSYEDLLSGNFSINAPLFKTIKMFDTSFRCREDYELGARLIKAGAEFSFSEKAWGYHRDESTSQERLFQRRKDEGYADVHFANKHPELLSRLPLSGFGHSFTSKKKIFLYILFNFHSFTDKTAFILLRFLLLYERLKLRSWWQSLGGKLNQYWYVRGITEQLNTQKSFAAFFQNKITDDNNNSPLELDLKDGLPCAENLIDRCRPDSLNIYYGPHFIGKLAILPGAEKLRGLHLRPILKINFSYTLLHAVIIEKIIKKPID